MAATSICFHADEEAIGFPLPGRRGRSPVRRGVFRGWAQSRLPSDPEPLPSPIQAFLVLSEGLGCKGNKFSSEFFISCPLDTPSVRLLKSLCFCVWVWAREIQMREGNPFASSLFVLNNEARWFGSMNTPTAGDYEQNENARCNRLHFGK